jgi:hypothetical protein
VDWLKITRIFSIHFLTHGKFSNEPKKSGVYILELLYQPMSFGQKNVKRWRREENVKEKGEKPKYNGEIEAKMVN